MVGTGCCCRVPANCTCPGTGTSYTINLTAISWTQGGHLITVPMQTGNLLPAFGFETCNFFVYPLTGSIGGYVDGNPALYVSVSCGISWACTASGPPCTLWKVGINVNDAILGSFILTLYKYSGSTPVGGYVDNPGCDALVVNPADIFLPYPITAVSGSASVSL